MKRTASNPEAERAREEQIQRLRQMLALIALETGTSALGASYGFTDPRAPHPRRDEAFPPPPGSAPDADAQAA